MEKMNIQWLFLDCNSNILSNRKVLFTPVKSPEITASFLTTADSYQFTTSNAGVLSASVVANNYKVEIDNPQPATNYFLTVGETGSFVYSGSIMSGSAQYVYFDLINLVKDPTKVKKLTLTPLRNYPVTFSGSLIALCSTSSVPDITGSAVYDQLVPGVYQVDALGKVDTTFYISVPTWYNTASLDGSWNAKDLLIVKPAKGTPVRLFNGDNSYVLTVSSSDARYIRAGDGIPNILSASHALYADNTGFVASTLTADFALQAAHVLYGVDSSSFASSSLSASVAQTASLAITASYALQALSASWSPAGISSSHANFADTSSVAFSATSASTALSSISSSYSLSSSFAPGSVSSSHANFADTASVTISTLSASFAQRAITSSFLTNATFIASGQGGSLQGNLSSSRLVAPDGITRVEVKSIPTGQILLQTGGLNQILVDDSSNTVTINTNTTVTGNVTATRFIGTADTASVALSASNAVSASWAPVQAGSMSTGSSYPITASQAVSASWARSASFAPPTPGTMATASFYPISASQATTASYATFAISSSWAPPTPGTMNTGSSYPITASWAVSASHANNADVGNDPHIYTSQSVQVGVLNSIGAFMIDALGSGSAQRLTRLYDFAGNVQASITSSGFTFNNPISASVVGSASYAQSASVANSASIANSASYALSASFARNAISASAAPLYVLKSGDTVSGILDFGSGAGVTLENSAQGVRFVGGTSNDFTLKIENSDLLGLESRVGTIYFTGSHIVSASLDGTASFARTASFVATASFAPTSSTAIGSFTIYTSSNNGAYLNFALGGLGGITASISANPSGIVFDHKILGQDCQMAHFIGDGSQLTNVSASTSLTASYLGLNPIIEYSSSGEDLVVQPDGDAFGVYSKTFDWWPLEIQFGGIVARRIFFNGPEALGAGLNKVLTLNNDYFVSASSLTYQDAEQVIGARSNIQAQIDAITSGSTALTASYALNAANAVSSSYALAATTASFALTTGNVLSASNARTASAADKLKIGTSGIGLAMGVPYVDVGGTYRQTFSDDANFFYQDDSHTLNVTNLITNFLVATGGSISGSVITASAITARLFGTASNALTASSITFVPATSSYALAALSASYAPGNPSISSSYAASASFAVSGTYSVSASNIALTHDTISAQNNVLFATGTFSDTTGPAKYDANGSFTYNPLTHTLTVSAITASQHFGTASYAAMAKSSSYAVTASIANAISFVPSTASYALLASQSLGIVGNVVPSSSYSSVAGFATQAGLAFNLNGTASFALSASYFNGNAVSASYALTCSFFNGSVLSASSATSASFATTASYALKALSASYAPSVGGLATGSTYPFTSSQAITASYLLNLELFRTSSLTVVTAAGSFNNLVGVFTTGSYDGAFIRYAVISSSAVDKRTGEMMVTWLNDGATIDFTETSTPSIGDTSQVEMSCDLSESCVRLFATVIPSNYAPFNVKSWITYI